MDVVGVLFDQPDHDRARNYWKVLKSRLRKEGNELVTACNQLKMKSSNDGKRYPTDVANTEQLLRIIQPVPSSKAEPFKLWLARVGAERIEETIDSERAIDRALETYREKDTAISGFISVFCLFVFATHLLMNGRKVAFSRDVSMQF